MFFNLFEVILCRQYWYFVYASNQKALYTKNGFSSFIYIKECSERILLNLWTLTCVTLPFPTVLQVPINHAYEDYTVFLSDRPAVIYTALEELG